MTLPQMLAAHARRYGRGKIALREKKYGIWQEVTWEDYAAHVRTVALGLEALGLRRGETLAIVCGNRPAWLYTELGAQALGLIDEPARERTVRPGHARRPRSPRRGTP